MAYSDTPHRQICNTPWYFLAPFFKKVPLEDIDNWCHLDKIFSLSEILKTNMKMAEIDVRYIYPISSFKIFYSPTQARLAGQYKTKTY